MRWTGRARPPISPPPTWRPDRARPGAWVAQLVEQRIENPCVAGSIPAQAPRFRLTDAISAAPLRGDARTRPRLTPLLADLPRRPFGGAPRTPPMRAGSRSAISPSIASAPPCPPGNFTVVAADVRIATAKSVEIDGSALAGKPAAGGEPVSYEGAYWLRDSKLTIDPTRHSTAPGRTNPHPTATPPRKPRSSSRWSTRRATSSAASMQRRRRRPLGRRTADRQSAHQGPHRHRPAGRAVPL